MKTIQKFKELKRVTFGFKTKMMLFYIKRKFKLKFSKNETTTEARMHDFLSKLVKYNGVLQIENSKFYITTYQFKKTTSLKLRKIPSTDLYVFDQVFGNEDYKSTVELMQKNSHFNENSHLNIIDAGGNIGLTTLYLSYYFPKSNFIIIEPDSSNTEVLKYNISKNIPNNYSIIQGGLWNRNANLEISKDFRGGGDWALRVVETQKTLPNSIKAYTIQKLMNENNFSHIDLLKIDIEGAEKLVFSSDSDTSFLSKTKYIAIEIHDEFNCREEIYNRLSKYGFKYFNDGELTIGFNEKYGLII